VKGPVAAFLAALVCLAASPSAEAYFAYRKPLTIQGARV
jgi:hypothetical protein